MRALSIDLKNYRNFDIERFTPGENINIIYGDNAQGKTNLIEAIWLFTGGRSFRSAKDAELIKFGSDFAKLDMEFFSCGRNQTASIVIEGKRRRVTLNKVEKKSAASLVGSFCAVVFSPNHLSLVKDGPAGRRRFIDSALCQIKPAYCSAVLKYNHILNQRNRLLKEIKNRESLIDTLDVWDENLSFYGAAIVKERIEYIELVKSKAERFYSGISDGKENFSVFYKSNLQKNDIIEVEEIKKVFLEKLQNSRNEDLILGYTSVGAHRDDLCFKVNNLNAKSFASQGQQRSCVLALKLAEAEIVMEQTGQRPIILLDDVMSELDLKRQKYLISSIKDWQVFITCCEMSEIIDLDEPQKFEINGGKIRKI